MKRRDFMALLGGAAVATSKPACRSGDCRLRQLGANCRHVEGCPEPPRVRGDGSARSTARMVGAYQRYPERLRTRDGPITARSGSALRLLRGRYCALLLVPPPRLPNRIY